MRARILVWWGGAFFCFCHLILIQDITMCVSRLAGTHDPPTSGLPSAEITDKHNQRQVLNREMDKHNVSKIIIIINLLKSLTFRSQVNYYITCMYVCGGSSRAGTAAPATAEEEIPCQKDASLHKSSRSITAPWRPARKPQCWGLATCQAAAPLFTCLPLLPMSLSATFGEAGHSNSNCHLVGLLSGLHTLRLLYSNRWGFDSYIIPTTISKVPLFGYPK